MTTALPWQQYFSANDEVSRLMRSHDWRASPLGPPQQWEQSLRNAVDLVLGSQFPMFILWGEQLCCIYNAAYRPILGARHPDALGQPFTRIWPELSQSDIMPIIACAIDGESSFFANLPVVVKRNGYAEQTW